MKVKGRSRKGKELDLQAGVSEDMDLQQAGDPSVLDIGGNDTPTEQTGGELALSVRRFGGLGGSEMPIKIDNPSKNAAITIVSKNYFSLATTLAQTYKQHHPDNDFIIILVDRADGYVPDRLECGAEVIELGRFRIPDAASFVYRYTIMELNTAVKPFVLADLFEIRGYETLLYIDPDILVFRPFDEIYRAFENASIVLTPHMRRPFYDNAHPSDVSILQSGTYNFGFVGLKRSESSRKLLDWWMSKLYRDCIVDIPNGLFVDQKWMDMVPGFFPDHFILHSPAYNVAYWNLHERVLSKRDGVWFTDDVPLAFFHFSGYSPFSPMQLSKHQNRFQLAHCPEIKAITDEYAELLLQNGYEETSSWPYAFETLSNGVRLPLNLVRDVMQWASRVGEVTPNPVSEPDEFCRYLMAKGGVEDKPNQVFLYHFLLKRRKDVAAAYPAALEDSSDSGFRGWLKNSGYKEEGISDLLEFESDEEPEPSDYVADLYARLARAGRQDVQAAFESMWDDATSFDNFVRWVAVHGVAELGLTPKYAQKLREAASGVSRILNLYFLRSDLQVAFPTLWEKQERDRFAKWLRTHRKDSNLSNEEITLFVIFTGEKRELIDKAGFLYRNFGKMRAPAPSIYDVDTFKYQRHIATDSREIVEWLATEDQIDPADHYVARYGRNGEALADFDRLSVPNLAAKKNYGFVKAVSAAMSAAPGDRIRVNFAGFLNAPSGMGESARSMEATLIASDVPFSSCTLPHPRATSTFFPTDPVLFGWPSGLADISISVANADCRDMLETILPSTFWTRRNIGYWVWETEVLPQRFMNSQTPFDEIWTPSHYSAAAIRKTTTRPVRVLPHTLDFAALDMAKADRKKFGLPETGVLFGFMFDPQSVPERKNVSGLIDAFQQAFGDDDDCYLILKVNGHPRDAYDYEMLHARATNKRIIFLETTFLRDETFDFLKSLDVYVSLHRAEGFGLTCAESMALGIPVVASNYSGNVDFMNEENSLLVPTKVIETERPYGPYPAGTRWGEPDGAAAATMMRSLMNAELREEIGAKGAASIRETLSHERLGKLARSYIEDVLHGLDA